jgi:hypothetical protein
MTPQGPPWGWTPTGFIAKPASVILAEMQQAIWDTIDPELDLSFQTPDGRMLAILASTYAEQWELLATANGQYNREDVEGAGLDNLGDLVGIPREGESYTQVYCTCGLNSASAPYLAGTLVANIVGLPAQTFANLNDVTTGDISGGSATVLFESTTIGPTPSVSPGTLTTITTPVTGWTAITNPFGVPGDGGTLGTSEELDSAYAERQQREIASEGSCNPSATAAVLVELGAAQSPPVTLTVSVLENTTPFEQIFTIPSPTAPPGDLPFPPSTQFALLPHTFLVVVYDGGTGWASGTPIAGTVALTNGSTSITFSQTQTLPTGTQLYFAEQPGIIYTIASPGITAGMTGTLTQPYSGITAPASAATIPGAGWALIGETIYANKPAGITSISTANGFAVIVDDPVLGDQVVYFTPPTPLPLYISATVAIRPGASWPTVQQNIIDALVAAAVAPTPSSGIPPTGQLTPGAYVIGSQLQTVIISASGAYDVQALTFGFNSAPSNTSPIAVSAIQIATILEANASNIALVQGSLP